DREPERPRAIDPDIDRDLETITLKCLEKDPVRRFGSAEALANELESWLRGEPIQSRPSTATERAWKWAKRRPAAAGLIATSPVAVVSGIIGLLIANAQIAARQRNTDEALKANEILLTREQAAVKETEAALEKVKEQQKKLEASLVAERRTAYMSDIALAASEWAANRPARASQILDGCQA